MLPKLALGFWITALCTIVMSWNYLPINKMVFGQEDLVMTTFSHCQILFKDKLIKKTRVYVVPLLTCIKAFDWANRDLLLNNLVSNNIDGNFICHKILMCETFSCVELRYNCRMEYFVNQCGVRQRDPLWPTFIGLYINDLARSLKENGPTIQVRDV